MFELRKPNKKEKELFNISIFKIFIIKNEENIIATLLSLVNDVLNERLEADCMFEDRLATKIMIISKDVIIVKQFKFKSKEKRITYRLRYQFIFIKTSALQ